MPGRSYYDLRAPISHITSSLKGGLIVVDPVYRTLHTTKHDQLSSILWVFAEASLVAGALGFGKVLEDLPDKGTIQPAGRIHATPSTIMSLSSIPHTLWLLYVDNLVNYKADSWVYSIASTCRLLAFAIIIPFILLTLLVR